MERERVGTRKGKRVRVTIQLHKHTSTSIMSELRCDWSGEVSIHNLPALRWTIGTLKESMNTATCRSREVLVCLIRVLQP